MTMRNDMRRKYMSLFGRVLPPQAGPETTLVLTGEFAFLLWNQYDQRIVM